MESGWQERLNDQRERDNELAEWRINELENAHKRRRVDDDREREEEWSSIQAKLERREGKLKEIATELEESNNLVTVLKVA